MRWKKRTENGDEVLETHTPLGTVLTIKRDPSRDRFTLEADGVFRCRGGMRVCKETASNIRHREVREQLWYANVSGHGDRIDDTGPVGRVLAALDYE